MVMSHSSLHNAAIVLKLFPRMCTDYSIAKEIQLNKDKVVYTICSFFKNDWLAIGVLLRIKFVPDISLRSFWVTVLHKYLLNNCKEALVNLNL